MTHRERVDQAAVWVVGVEEGTERLRFRLEHGLDPEEALRARGFRSVRVDRVEGDSRPHELRLVYRVRRRDGTPADTAPADTASVPGRPWVDAGLVIGPQEAPVRHQRVAAYAVVLSERGVLLSQMSGRTNARGSWGLCGGGVDPGELPEEALHREVREESSQLIEVSGLARISTRHWVGRAPHGRLEDFQAIRIIYRATCSEPTDPVVLDVGGTTEASAWVSVAQVAHLPLTPGWRDIIVPLLDAHQ